MVQFCTAFEHIQLQEDKSLTCCLYGWIIPYYFGCIAAVNFWQWERTGLLLFQKGRPKHFPWKQH